MVNIRPFRGYRYNENKVDIGKAVLPPYELTNEEFKNIFLKISKHNVIRINLGKNLGKRNGTSNGDIYQYSADLFRSWIKKGCLKQDERPSVYVYSQEFELFGRKIERTGFSSLVELEELGKNIFPHEETLQDTMINRKMLLEKTRANLGLIFSLYSDPQKTIEKMIETAKRKPPVADFYTEYEGVRHKLWAITDKEMIEKITKEMQNKKLLIADGHHRYKTCLSYSRDHPHDENAKYTSMMLVNMSNEGLMILPTHRLVKGIKNFNKDDFMKKLGKNFETETIEFGGDENKIKDLLGVLNKKNGKHFGMYLGGEKFFILTVRTEDEQIMDRERDRFSRKWRRLDMNILHTLILRDILGIYTEKMEDQCHMEYVKDFSDHAKSCITKVKNGECQAAFFVNPITIDEMKEITQRGEMIPPKSTCFYPKVYSGVVMYKF
jgi:uncharacterized protein (DUF1015 family)